MEGAARRSSQKRRFITDALQMLCTAAASLFALSEPIARYSGSHPWISSGA